MGGDGGGASSRPGVSEAEDQARRIGGALPSIKGGSLRFWGEWFGRPGDNFHRLVGAQAEGDALRLAFDMGERVTLWSARGLELSAGALKIATSARVRLDWFSYGAEPTPANLRFMDFTHNGERVFMTSSAGVLSKVITDIDEPAFEIV